MPIRHYILGMDLIQRRLTTSLRVLPNVFLLGATKAGSTSLAHILWQHPAHVTPFAKELMYLQKLPNFYSNWEFSRAAAFVGGRFRHGHARFSTDGYRKFFPTRYQMRRNQSEVGAAITSDCDPFNFYCEVATKRIATLAPDARFIISLRDPVRRAFSDFNMHRTRGGDTRTFSQAIDQELCGSERRFRKCFVYQSVYAPHVERWFQTFPRGRFLIVCAEDLFADPRAISHEMFRFLGLGPAQVDCSARNRGKYDYELDSDSEERLRDYFHPFNRQLYDLLNCDLGWA